MTNAEINDVLDQISMALQKVHHKSPSTYAKFYDNLTQSLSNFPKNLLLKDIEDLELQTKITKIWKLFFARNQRRQLAAEIKLGTLDLKAREILIAHKFYLDCKFTDNKTIIFKLLDSLNISLILPTCRALNELGILKETVYTKLTSSNMNIFELLEALINQKTELGEQTSLIKLQETNRFAAELLTACNTLNIPHGFKNYTPKVIYKRHNKKSFDQVAADCEALNPTRPDTLEFLSKRHSWDFEDKALDNIEPENIVLYDKKSNKRHKLSVY